MKIAVWYHCLIAGPRIPSSDFAVSLVQEQMAALQRSGLAERADEIHIGFNGSSSDAMTICSFVPDKSILHVQPDGQSEVATLHQLQQWLNPGWMVLYHHIKGVQHLRAPSVQRWRRCMERVCVWNWRECASFLEQGFDTVGAHWLHNPKCKMIPPSQKYWGGNFWWANSDYLLRLPQLAQDSHANRYEAEVWIGKVKPHPRIHDFAPHFPTRCR